MSIVRMFTQFSLENEFAKNGIVLKLSEFLFFFDISLDTRTYVHVVYVGTYTYMCVFGFPQFRYIY